MSELDDKWSEMLEQATARARADGRAHVADYLHLKSVNDAIRVAGVGWLVDSLLQIATELDGIAIERVEPHSFKHDGTNVVGTMLKIRQGVRCLTIEAGWPRTPSDGFMRRGALAVARVVHFGMPRNNAELSLVRAENGIVWVFRDQSEAVSPFDGDQLQSHFKLFLSS